MLHISRSSKRYGGSRRSKKVRQACRKDLDLLSPETDRGLIIHDPKPKKVNDEKSTPHFLSKKHLNFGQGLEFLKFGQGNRDLN